MLQTELDRELGRALAVAVRVRVLDLDGADQGRQRLGISLHDVCERIVDECRREHVGDTVCCSRRR